jgi:hypothetical protein
MRSSIGRIPVEKAISKYTAKYSRALVVYLENFYYCHFERDGRVAYNAYRDPMIVISSASEKSSAARKISQPPLRGCFERTNRQKVYNPHPWASRTRATPQKAARTGDA